MSLNLTFGEIQLQLCGQVENAGSFVSEDDGKEISFASIAVIGKTLKITCDRQLAELLEGHKGRVVSIVGHPGLGGEKDGPKSLKITKVHQVFDTTGKQIYSSQAGSSPVAQVARPVAAAASPFAKAA